MNEIPRTFCITLKETPLRRKGFLESTSTLGFPIMMFEGVLGSRLGLVPKFSNEFECPSQKIMLNENAIGCNMSHFMLWQVLKYMPEDEFFVLEDDAVLDVNFLDKFHSAYNELPEDWEMAYVGWLPNDEDRNPIVVNDQISIRTVSATHAYLIKKSILPRLCESILPFQSNIDLTIIHKVLPHIKYYVFDPSIVSQRSYLNTSDAVWASLVYDWQNDLYGCKRTLLKNLFLKEGWYKLERDRDNFWRWSKDSFEIFVSKTIDSMSMKFSTPIDNVLLIFVGNETLEFPINYGNNEITIPIKNNDKIDGKLKTPFRPSEVDPSCNDTRSLGICLSQITMNIGMANVAVDVQNI